MSNTKIRGLTKEEIIAVITQEVPHLISEHPEVRYELIGVMSELFVKKDEYIKILSEIKALREDFNLMSQQIKVNTQEIKALREATDRNSQEIKALREATDRNSQEIKALREDFNLMSQQIKVNTQEIKALREDFGIMSQEIKALREDFGMMSQEMKALREDFHDLRKYMDKSLRNLNNKIEGLGARWGLMSETAFRNGLKEILTEETGLKVERYEERDDEGYVFGQPAQIEIDIVVKDGVLILVEIKSSISRGDVLIFQRKIEFYEKKHNVKVRQKIIISPAIDLRAGHFAQYLGMEISTSALDTII